MDRVGETPGRGLVLDVGVTMAATKPLDADPQLIVNHVRVLVQFHMDRQRAAGHTPDEMAQQRATLVAGIIEGLAQRTQP
jgi:hypothetical protein